MVMRAVFFLAFLSATTIGIASASAGGIQPSGLIIGSFSDPVLNGYVANEPSLGVSTAHDNTSTAIKSIVNSPDGLTGSKLQWGSNTGGGPGTFSELTFFGEQVGPDPYNQPFLAGMLTLLNGTSSLDSLIFGALLSFRSANGVVLGTDNVTITTTSNTADVTNPVNADYLNICGNSSNICNLSIETFEGASATFGLYAKLYGDPMLGFTGVTLIAVPDEPDGGRVSDRLPVPGPTVGGGASSFAFAALLLGWFVTRRRSQVA
jgi:hypothetical protein